MGCSVWSCVVVCCSVVQCEKGARAASLGSFLSYSVVHCVVVCCSGVQCGAVCCSVLQCVEMCSSVLHCVAVCWQLILQKDFVLPFNI